MPKYKTEPEFPVPGAKELVRFAGTVCEEYERLRLRITLRQLYYQGVIRQFLPSHQKSYDDLKLALSNARLRGRFPLDAIVDRTRHVLPGLTTRNDVKVSRALSRAAEAAALSPDRFLHRDRWFGQPVHVSVWFEKEALADLFEVPARELGISSMSCKGEPSHAVLYEWLRSAAVAQGVANPGGWQDREGDNRKGMAKRSVILYFGDHDPTGIRIPRTAVETIRTFAGIAGLSGLPVELIRVGLNLEQARELRLPPFPAKESSGADYDRYIVEFGTREAWELDAIPPELVGDMVRRAVLPHFDLALHERLQADVERRRAEMRNEMKRPLWHEAATNFLEVS